MRQTFWRLYHGRKGFKMWHYMPWEIYWKEMTTAIFCFAPAGAGPGRAQRWCPRLPARTYCMDLCAIALGVPLYTADVDRQRNRSSKCRLVVHRVVLEACLSVHLVVPPCLRHAFMAHLKVGPRTCVWAPAARPPVTGCVTNSNA